CLKNRVPPEATKLLIMRSFFSAVTLEASVASNSLRAASMPKRGSLATCAGLRIVRTNSGVRTIVPPRSRRTLEGATVVWMASSSDMSHHSCGCWGGGTAVNRAGLGSEGVFAGRRVKLRVLDRFGNLLVMGKLRVVVAVGT